MSGAEQYPELVRRIQSGVPLVTRPYAAIAADVGMDVDAVIEVLQTWSRQGLLREISAVLESEAFGWESALVACAVAPERIEAVAATVGAHPNVTHNYERTHTYNLWFTLAVPPEMGLDRTLRLLEEEAQAGPFLPLPRTTTFKIAVRMDPTSKRNRSHGRARRTPVPRVELGERDELFFRLLQTPLPFCPHPFRELGVPHGVGERELLDFGAHHMGGAMRRYAATFHHRRLGVRGNVMSGWAVPEHRIEEVGQALAGLPEVSHCYARAQHEAFPFTLYAMIHAATPEDCAPIAEAMASRLGVPNPAMLQSTREFKKCRLRYFLPELDTWWSRHQPARRSQT